MVVPGQMLRASDSLVDIAARVRESAARDGAADDGSHQVVAIVRGFEHVVGAELSRNVLAHDEALILSGLNLRTVALETVGDPALPVSLPKQCVSVSLAANSLSELPALASFAHPNITALFLNTNHLHHLNLGPLAQCNALERLWLHSNRLTRIDLSPLQNCRALKSLYLDHNRLTSVDLAPLANCTLLKALRLTGNPLQGPLDITPLTGCISLSLFDVDQNVALIAAHPSGKPGATTAPLPLALRRRSHSISWLAETPDQTHNGVGQTMPAVRLSATQNGAKAQKKTFSVLVAGFGRNARSAIERLFREASFDVTTVRLDIKVLTEPQLLQPYDALLVEVGRGFQESAVIGGFLTAIQKARPGIVVALVGNGKDHAETARHAARHGARMLNQPLGQRDAMDLHSLVHKAKSAPVPYSPRLGGGGPAIKTSLSLDSLSDAAQILRSKPEVPRRDRMEMAAMERAFERCSGKAKLDDLDGIMSLLRLPSCVSPILLERGGHKHFVDKSWLTEFWENSLASAGPDERLFHIVNGSGRGRFVTVATISRIVFFLMIPLRYKLENVEFFQDYVDIATASLCFAMNGAIHEKRPVLQSDMRRSELCRYLRAAERGCHAGPLAECTFNTMQGVRFEFYDAIGSGSFLSKAAFTDYNRRRGILTSSASHSIFEFYSVDGAGGKSLSLVAFTRFCKAISTVGEVTALEYFWPVLDSDLDGFLSEGDLVSLFRDKASILRSKGLEAVDLGHIFSNLYDMADVFALPGGLDGRSVRGLPLCHFRSASKDDRAFLIRALLFREEDLIVLDLKRTLDVNSPQGNS